MAPSDLPLPEYFENPYEEMDWEERQAQDDRLMNQIITAVPGEGEPLINLDRPLDLGEKADDAEDYEDISDDDLPEEEPATLKQEEGHQ